MPVKKASTISSRLNPLLEPFEGLSEEKRDLLRGVLQIYVTKDAAAHTDLEKRRRLSHLIESYAKGAEQ